MIRPFAFRQLADDSRGATAVEFALLAPAFIAMLFGVLQIGIAFQNYNALRSMSADVARYAMVENARGAPKSNETLTTYAQDLGSGAPYLLAPNRLDVEVISAATQRVTGANELTMTLEYEIPSILAPLGLRGPTVEYERPIFLATN